MNKELIGYLIELGLEREVAVIYERLVANSSMTVLELSRTTKVNRTKIYRTLEEMKLKRLVSEEIEENTTKYSPAPIERIKEMLEAKKSKVERLTNGFPEIEKMVEQMSLGVVSPTKVKFYRGKDGIKQMVWNVLRAKSEVVGYTYRDLSEFIGESYMQEFASEFVRRNLKMRDLYGENYKESKKIQYAWMGHIESKMVSDSILTIDHQMDIYDEVVSFYNWHEGEVFGVEIYNPKVAKMQRQLFELAWKVGSGSVGLS